MLLRTRYYIYKEIDNLLEFREKKSILFIESTFLLFFGGVLLLPNLLRHSYDSFCLSEYRAYLIVTVVGVIIVYIGLVNFFSQGKIILNKKTKEIVYIGGFKKLIFLKCILHFDEISHIYIQEESGRGGMVLWDNIFWDVKKKSNIKIDSSGNDSYSNMLVRKISEFIECEVYFFSE